MKLRVLTGVFVYLILGCAITSAANNPVPQSFVVGYGPLSQIAIANYPALDLSRVAAEDALREANGHPHRFAIPHLTSIDVNTAGTWEQHGDMSIWRLHVQAAKASSLNFGFTQYRLPPSARLYIYDADRRQVAGPYDSSKNAPHGQLWTPIIASGDVIIELDVATAERDQVTLLLGSINQGYRGLGGASKDYHQPDVGGPKLGKSCSPDQIRSGTCNMDVACLDENDPWNDPSRAVGAITKNGSDTCTGSLINNTSEDRRMLFLTATHCGLTQSSSPTVVVYWNYDWPTCRTPGSSASGQSNAPDPNMSSSGATFLARTPSPFDSGCNSSNNTTCSDSTLVELDDPPNPAWNLFWEGWDRRTTAAQCSQSTTDPSSTEGLCASIHHPNVDEKRITFVKRDFEVDGITNGIDTHWHAYWDTTPPILANIPDPQPSSLPPGVTEPGSSGSPLYTSDQRLVGVLSGGYSYCGATGENLSDEYGQLALAWDGLGTPATRLKDALDPLGTAPDYIDGIGMSPFGLSLDPTSVAVCASVGSADINIAVIADPGFSAAVALSARDEPAGSSVSFAPASVTPPGSSVLTVGSLGAAAPGAYMMTVTGTSGADSVSKSLPFALNDAAPDTVILSMPNDNATAVSTSPVLTWQAASSGGPTTYLVEVATDAAFANVVFSQNVTDATSATVTPALDPSTNYYWRVSAGNACGDAAASAVFQFRTLSAPGSCEPPTTAVALFSDDMESGDNGWTTTGSSGASTWLLSTARPNSGGYAWYANDLGSISDQRLISPSIVLPSDQNPITLSFENWRQMEASSGGGCYDGGLIEISTDGSTFTQLPDSAIIDGGSYNGTISGSFSNPLAGLSAWCTNTARPYSDGATRVDLTNYAGQTVNLRFRLGSDSSVGKEGWYVDDVDVTACGPDDTIFKNGFELP